MQACTRIYNCYEDVSQTEYMSIHSRRPPACALAARPSPICPRPRLYATTTFTYA